MTLLTCQIVLSRNKPLEDTYVKREITKLKNNEKLVYLRVTKPKYNLEVSTFL